MRKRADIVARASRLRSFAVLISACQLVSVSAFSAATPTPPVAPPQYRTLQVDWEFPAAPTPVKNYALVYGSTAYSNTAQVINARTALTVQVPSCRVGQTYFFYVIACTANGRFVSEEYTYKVLP